MLCELKTVKVLTGSLPAQLPVGAPELGRSWTEMTCWVVLPVMENRDFYLGLWAHPKGPGKAVKFHAPSRRLGITAYTFIWSSSGHTAGNSLGGNLVTTALWNCYLPPFCRAGTGLAPTPFQVERVPVLQCTGQSMYSSHPFAF